MTDPIVSVRPLHSGGVIGPELWARIVAHVRRCMRSGRPVRLAPCIAIPAIVMVLLEQFEDARAIDAMVNEGGPA